MSSSSRIAPGAVPHGPGVIVSGTQVTRSPGRPSRYRRAAADDILARLADGESLRAICRADGMPPESTVRGWAIDDVDGFAARYARARELQAHAVAEEGLAQAMTAFDAQVGRLRFDACRWFAGKLLPGVYGERQHVEHSGRIAADPAALSDAELARIAAGGGGRTAASPHDPT